jgi:5'(3')-deoxyribonucleotidase
MQKLKIAYDLDGVGFWFTNSFRMYLHEHHGKALEEMPDPTIWDFWDEWSMTREDWLFKFDSGVKEGYIFRHGEPMEGFSEAITELQAEGHSIHIITSRPQHGAIPNTAAWLEEYAIPYDSLTFAGYKAVVDFDVLLDDLPTHCCEAVKAGRQAVCFSGPKNSYNSPENYPEWTGPRVKTHGEFVELVMVGTFDPKELVSA